MTRKQSKAKAALHKHWFSKTEQKKRQNLNRSVQAEMLGGAVPYDPDELRRVAIENTTGVRGLNVKVYPEIELRHGEAGK